jgi:hypothetical protein
MHEVMDVRDIRAPNSIIEALPLVQLGPNGMLPEDEEREWLPRAGANIHTGTSHPMG